MELGRLNCLKWYLPVQKGTYLSKKDQDTAKYGQN